MRKFLPLLIVVILLVSMIGITAALAGASISGSSIVVAGKSYTYKGTAKYSSGDLVCKIEGLGQVSSGFAGASGLVNQSLTATASIKVKIPSTAQIGDKYTISFSGSYSIMKADGSGDVQSGETFSTSKTITVGVPPTRDPNAPLVGWEIVEAAVEDAAPGAPVVAELEGKYNKIPGSLFEMIIDNKSVLTIDYGTYKVTIDPAKLKDISGIKTLDLSLSFEKSEELSEAAGGKDIYQLHFGHSGEFPGMIAFTFEASENEPGDTVYLYYYFGASGALEGKAEAVVDENGMVTFEIYHASSYFVTAEVLPDAVINFDSESADALAALEVTYEDTQSELAESQTALSDSQTEFSDSQTQIAALEVELADKQIELDDAARDLENEKSASAAQAASSVSLIVFIIVLAAVLILSALGTMLVFKVGLFKRLGQRESEL